MEKERRTMSCLPRDLRIDIFTRLSIKALARCRFVCKDWKNFINDPIFIEFYHSRLNKNDPNCLILCHTYKKLSGVYLVDNEKDDTKLTAFKISFHDLLPQGKIGLIGSCNGLICLRCSGYFYICNPIIGDTFKLPKQTIDDSLPESRLSHSKPSSSGFGFDATTNMYKVIYTFNYRDSNGLLKTGVEIFNLGKGKWRRITDFPAWFYVTRYTYQVFVCGALHWEKCVGSTIFKEREIVALDIETESFSVLTIPTSVDSRSTRTLTSLGEHLCFTEHFASSDVKFAVWIMQDYGIQESWTKKYIIRSEMVSPLGLRYSLKILKMVKNDSILLHDLTGQGYYDLKNKRHLKHFIIRGFPLFYDKLEAIVHVGSLISPTRLAGVSTAEAHLPDQHQIT